MLRETKTTKRQRNSLIKLMENRKFDALLCVNTWKTHRMLREFEFEFEFEFH